MKASAKTKISAIEMLIYEFVKGFATNTYSGMACFKRGVSSGWMNPVVHIAIAISGIKINAEALFDLNNCTNIEVLKINLKN